MRARGLGAKVIVTEIDPMKALEAAMDGYRVMPMDEAAPIGDIFITVTGNKTCSRASTSSDEGRRGDVCNTGHFNVEIRSRRLRPPGHETRELRVTSSRSSRSPTAGASTCSGRTPGQPRRRRGAPARVMDMSFANQALAAESW